MPPTTTGMSSSPASFMRITTSLTSGTCEPDRIESPTTCARLLARRLDDLGGREADALVDYVHAGVARPHRDLLGAVGVAVEARLADQEFQPASELLRHPVDVGAQVVGRRAVVARGTADAGRRAVLTEVVPQHLAPFAGGDAGLRADDRCRHDIAAVARRLPQLFQRGFDRLVVARCAPGVEPRDLLGLDPVRHREDGVLAGTERRGLGLLELVDADHGQVAALDRLDALRVRTRRAGPSCSPSRPPRWRRRAVRCGKARRVPRA